MKIKKIYFLVIILLSTVFTIVLSNTNSEYILPCESIAPSYPIPNDVRFVKPSDIKVVMAIGDSLSAGFGVNYQSFGDFMGESRGVSWSLGGDGDEATIPNFLRKIGAKTKGQSHGKLLPYLHFLPENLRPQARNFEVCQLNAAESQGILADANEQIEYLSKYLDNIKPSIDEKNDWKLLNYFIGCNDLCDVCSNNEKQSIAYWEKTYLETLRNLRQKFTRLIVNVILLPEISDLGLIGKGESCMVLRKTLQFCDCADTLNGRNLMKDRRIKFNNIITNATNYINSFNNNDFRAVIQPFLVETKLKRDYLSNLDCFHLNEKGSRYTAIGLWNNMIAKPEHKSRFTDENVIPNCPSYDTYLVS